MVIITIDNSYSIIAGLSLIHTKLLQKKLTYVLGGSSAYFSGYGVRYKSLLNSRGEFATGLLHHIYSFLDFNKIPYNCIFKNKPPLHQKRLVIIKDFIPYEAQLEAVSQAIINKRGTISMPTGTGKSYVIKMIIAELNVKTLVVVPTLELKNQLRHILKDIDNVLVENIDSKALNSALNYDCLIIDEGHHAAAKTYQKLNKRAWKGIYYRFFFTATPFRNDTEETLLFESICGKIIYKLSYKEAISKSYIVPIEAYYIECEKQITKGYTYSEIYSELIVRNIIKNNIIAKLAKLLNNNNLHTLVLVKEIAHGNELARLTNIKFIHSSIDNSKDIIKQFNNGSIKSLIGTLGLIGEGIDTKPCEYIIIAGGGKSKIQFMQAIGRGVRKYNDKESAKIILLKDKSHKYLVRHFNIQKKILLEEYGINILKLSI